LDAAAGRHALLDAGEDHAAEHAGPAAGNRVGVLQYDHDLEQFVSAGTAHVSADGSVIVSDDGFDITKAGWGHGPTFPLPPNCTQSCNNTKNPCVTKTPLPNCGCHITNNDGVACGSNTNVAICKLPGTCFGGYCSGGNKPDGSSCNDGIFCNQPETCKTGVCSGTPIPPKNDPTTSSMMNVVSFQLNFQSIANPVVTFFGTYGLGFQIVPTYSLGSDDKLVCCESMKQMNVPVLRRSVTAGINIVTGKLGIPGFSIFIPGPGTVGFYGQLGGSITGTATHRSSICDNDDCWSGKITLGIGLTGGLTALVADVNLSGGIQSSLEVGCKEVIGTIETQDIKAQGSITLGPFINFVVGPYVFVPSFVIAQVKSPI
jgi:hypothetical protein